MKGDERPVRPIGPVELEPIQPNRPPFWRHRAFFAFTAIIILTLVTGIWMIFIDKPSPPAKSVVTKRTAPEVANHWKGTVDPKAIPLGDGKVATSPQAGYIDTCTTKFRGGGAQHAGPWINSTEGAWDSQAKTVVAGDVTWPAAEHTEKLSGDSRIIRSNDLPDGYTTGIFPIARSDPAYQYDRNPNRIGTQSVTYELPLNPTAAQAPSCTGLGPIGIFTNGVLLFNGLDDAGRDAVAHETQDSCNGHPNGQEMYHYHNVPSCLKASAKKESILVGYALDGYGIYVERDAAGNLPTNADLDECHGRVSEVTWNGKKTSIYHYDATLEYPYTIGCYHGTPAASPGQSAR